MEKELDKNQKAILALSLIIIGILFLAVKSSVVSIVVTVAGVLFLVLGIIDLIHKDWTPGIIKTIVGILLIVFAWVFANVMLYVFGALLVAYGIYLGYKFITNRAKPKDVLSLIIEICIPILCIVVGILIFFNTNVVFTISGILLIVSGIIMLLQQYIFKK